MVRRNRPLGDLRMVALQSGGEVGGGGALFLQDDIIILLEPILTDVVAAMVGLSAN